MVDLFLTQRQVRDSVIGAGGVHQPNPSLPPGNADILGAIAMTETAIYEMPGWCNFSLLGDLDKVGESTGFGDHYGPSVTCFQIRTIQEQLNTGSIRDQNWLTSSVYNACLAALEISRGTRGFDAWTTYRTGAYKAFLPEFYPPPDGRYVVVSGDTLYGIDIKLNLPRGMMLQMNPTVDPRNLNIGQLLVLPYVTRTVAAGQTLTQLMKTAGWTTYTTADINLVADFARIGNPNLIYPNQVLRILKPWVILTEA